MDADPAPPMEAHPVPIHPSPVPTTFSVGQVVSNGNGDMLAQLQVITPTGTHVVFLDPNAAMAVGQALMKVAEMSSSGLIMP